MQWFCPCGQYNPRRPSSKIITWLLLSRLQGNKPHRNSASGTYTNTCRNFSEPSGTFRTLPPEPTPTRAGTLQNPPEPSETFRNQPFGTFRNLPPEPTSGTYASTRRNSPEPSGTFLRNLLLRPAPAPELIWAQDPFSLRCWGKKEANPGRGQCCAKEEKCAQNWM